MFFISPIKALYNIKFYLQKLQEPLWKAFCFVLYLFILGAIVATIYSPIKVKPVIISTIEEIAEITPDISVNKGIITVNNNKKLVISHPKLQGYKIIFDTASTEPAYPTQMVKENILIYVNKNRVYASYNGQFQKYAIPVDKNFTISKQELLNNKDQVAGFGAYLIAAIFIFSLLFQMVLYTLIALLIVFIINLATKSNLGFKRLLILALYLQAPILAIYFLLLLLPFQIMGLGSIIIIIAIVVYTNLILGSLRGMLTTNEDNN